MGERHLLENPRKIYVKELNDYLICSLCGGYLIDATAIVDCSHTFCRACIVRHFESSHFCPNCRSLVHKSNPLSKLRSDTILQNIVYKIVPSLYAKELQRRSDFYHSTGCRPNSSCSDDSVLGDRTQDNDAWVASNVGDPNLFFSLDDPISISVEGPEGMVEESEVGTEIRVEMLKRYLQCPAAVKMEHLKRFLRMKFALSDQHKVDLIYAGEILPPYMSLMDIAYIFKWTREKPMRFFYRIYVPVKRPVLPPPQPAPIVANDVPPSITEITVVTKPPTLQVQIEALPATNLSDLPEKPSKSEIVEEKNEDNNNVKTVQKSVKFISDSKLIQKSVKFTETNKFNNFEVKLKNSNVSDAVKAENCVYDYTEPDKEEIKAFAERRDREWAMQKYPETEVHVSKKRKKNKHSKSEFMHKKRKLHAEITSNEVLSKSDDSLKLKVKLSVANGHKHKHKGTIPTAEIVESSPKYELTPKERLLQMRQVRHKNISVPAMVDDKPKVVIDVPVASKPLEPEPSRETSDFLTSGKTLRSDFTIKRSISKDICNKYVRVNLEKSTDGLKKVENKKNSTAINLNEIPDKTVGIKPEIPVEPIKKVEDKPEDSKKPDITIVEKPVDESKLIENKLNNIDFKTSQALVTKNFTVSKVEPDVKRKLEPETSDKRPSLEITVINLGSRPLTSTISTKPVNSNAKPMNSNTKPVNSTTKSVNSTSIEPPVKKIRPPPLTIPLGRIQKMNLAKAQEKCDVFGALDLSAKPTKVEMKPKLPQQLQGMLRSKSAGDEDKSNMSNLQMLSESAVQIREMMTKNPSTTLPIPNLIKKTPPHPLKPADLPSKLPNLLSKHPLLTKPIPPINQLPRPNFLPKNLQKLPKLNEINKSQFCRMNSAVLRAARPAAQNQTIRNIPNPSLLVRQQNQNRFNTLNNSNLADTTKLNNTKDDAEKKTTEMKASEPPPLKPIEAFKK